MKKKKSEVDLEGIRGHRIIVNCFTCTPPDDHVSFLDLIVEPAVNIGNISPYQTDDTKPEEPSFIQLTRLEPVEVDQQSGIGTGDYPDDPSQVSNLV